MLVNQLVVEEELELYAPVKVYKDRDVKFWLNSTHKFSPDKESVIQKIYQKWNKYNTHEIIDDRIITKNDDGLISIIGINLSANPNKQYVELVQQYQYSTEGLNKDKLKEVKLKNFKLLPKHIKYNYHFGMLNLYGYEFIFCTIEVDSKEYIIRGVQIGEDDSSFKPLPMHQTEKTSIKCINKLYSEYAIFFPEGENNVIRVYKAKIYDSSGRYEVNELNSFYYTYGEANLSLYNKTLLNKDRTKYMVNQLKLSEDYNIYAIASSFDGYERIISGTKLLELNDRHYEEFSDSLGIMVKRLHSMWKKYRTALVKLSQKSKKINIIKIHVASNRDDKSYVEIVQQFTYDSIQDPTLTQVSTIETPDINITSYFKNSLFLEDRILYQNQLYYYTVLLPDGVEAVIESAGTSIYSGSIQQYKHNKEDAFDHILRYYTSNHLKFPSEGDYMDFTIQVYEIKFNAYNEPIDRTLVNMYCYDYKDVRLSELEYDETLAESFGLI